MGILITVVLPLALAFIMFSLGLGLTIDDFKRVLIRPFAFFTGAIHQLLLLPAVAFILAIAFGLPPELAVGFMILSFCPGGVTSNIMSKIAKGDVALSVSLTAVISLVTVVTIPLLVAVSVTFFMGSEAPPVNITSLAISVFLITTLPVLIGVSVRHFATGFADKAESIVSTIANVLFVIIVVAALATNWGTFVENLGVLAPSLVTLNILLLLIGFLIPKILNMSWGEIKTISVETGVQNATVGIALGAIISGQSEGFSTFALPSAVYGITMYIVTVPVLLWFRGKAS